MPVGMPFIPKHRSRLAECRKTRVALDRFGDLSILMHWASSVLCTMRCARNDRLRNPYPIKALCLVDVAQFTTYGWYPLAVYM